MRRLALSAALVLHACLPTLAEPAARDTQRGDDQIGRYFQQQVEQLREACLTDVTTLEHWQQQRDAENDSHPRSIAL